MTTLDRAMMLVPRGPAALPDELMNRRLRTVEDVHNFFQAFINPGGAAPAAKDPSQNNRAHTAPARVPPFKFVYCAKVDSGLNFRPYDLTVVARGQQPKRHYVVSPTAVVHVVPGSAESDVVLITDWLKQSKQFDALRKITFFRTYLKRKMMRCWLQNISIAKYHQNRAKLGKRLFLSKATFAPSTMQLRRLSFDMRLVQKADPSGKLPAAGKGSQFSFGQQSNDTIVKGDVVRVSRSQFPIRLIFYPDTRPQWGYTAVQFLEVQQNHHARVCAVLQKITDDIITTLSKVVDNVSQCAAVVPDLQNMQQLDEYLSIDSNVKPGVGTLHKQERDLEKQHRKRALKQRMIEYDFLQPWIRLVDSMMAEELFLNLINTFDTFSKHLDLPAIGQHRELRISFQVCCVFEGSEPLLFRPNVDDVLALVDGFVTDTVRKIGSLVRCVEMKELRAHFYRNPTPTPLAQVTQDYGPFTQSVERIRKAIRRDFVDGLDKAKSYEACRSCQQFVQQEWVEEYKSWPERALDKNKESCLQEADIKKFIAKVLKFRGELSRMSNKHCGVLSINIEPLTSELSQKLDAVQTDIKTSLLVLASRRVNEVGKLLETNIQMLKFPPMELRDFSEWIERCNKVEKDAKELLHECAEVESLYVVAEDHGFDCPQAQKDKRERTVGNGKGGEPLRVQFSDAIAAAKSFRETHVDEVKQQLTVAVMDTVGVLENITDELRNGEYKESTHSSSLILSKLHGVHNNLQSLKAKRDALNGYANLLGAMEPPWDEFKTATDVYDRKSDLWNAVARWEERRSHWNRTPVSQLDGEKIKEEMTELFQKSHKLNKADPDSVTERLLSGITVEKANLAVMVELCNPALKEEHWLKIFDGIGKRLPPPDARTLETLRTFGAYQHQELINSVSAVATGEYTLVKQIQKIAMVWEKMEFTLVKNRETDANCILGGVDELMLELEDNQVQVQTCLASRYVGGIRQMVEDWDTKLQLIRDVVDEWVNVQKSWMYLEFIFSSDDIKKQLPEESKMFAQVDKTYRLLMTKAQANNNAATICTEEGLLINLRQSNAMLDKIQKRLEDYLETKRVAFPRFYFLSNDELLSILSDVRNPTAVQPHLQKCFDNIKELNFDDSHTISAMKSTEGEVVQFPEKIKVVGNVENWLNDIERMMRRTLYETMGTCVDRYPKSIRNEWYFEFPAQCIGCVDQIVWTAEMEEVWAKIAEGNDKACHEYLDGFRKQILDTVELVKGKLTRLQRTCVCTLIVIDVHARDVVSGLIEADCTTVVDFNWQKQLRYYWTDGGSGGKVDCHIHHSAARVTYGYEYLGNQLRLVITPLTERAFLTCTSALHIFQGAAPQGPAGTGKTESVKDLGKALARQVVVFNCSDGLNYKMMSQMFAGLAQAGAWACFDEFNRIEIEVLSVVAQQMLEITTAIGNKQDSMIFDGHKIRLHKNFGVFITMNPGYAGRTELPDNLKALFRPICMMIPDYALIAEIMFFSEGFADARSLAQKMVRLYSLASQQLSKQDHYDFGMRAVKSILVMAGSLKRAEPHNPEDMILIRAMRDSNVPKFLREDTTLFMALISDLFPSVEIKEMLNEHLDKGIRSALAANGLQIVDRFIEKIVQLYETMVVRHGVMLVGQTITGKTVNADMLAETLTTLHTNGVEAEHEAHKRFFFPVKILRLNPKSITMGEMYGDINRITREWQDGVLSNIVRDLVRLTTPDRYWVCFDGPVDAIWIENMNTVLDDNKLLCLVNGERIKIPDTISIMFEVQDLRVASPATVSRCGMVFMEPYYLGDGWSAITKSKSEKLVAQGSVKGLWRHERFLDLCNTFVPTTLTFLRKECKEYIATLDAQLAINLFELLHASLLNADVNDDGDDVEIPGKVVPHKVEDRDNRKLFDALYLQSFIWAFGGNTNDRSRAKFSDFMQKLIKESGFVFPEASVFDYFLHKGSLTWQTWSYKVPQFAYNPSLSYFELLVPTTDTIILRHLLSTACTVNKHVLVNGVTGTAKSSSVSNFLVATLNTEDPSSNYASFAITFSAQTSSLNFQETVESKLVRRRGDKELGPPPGKRMIAMIDDCNMPQLEQYGASPPIELMRQMISQGGIYDRKKLFFKEIIDMMFIACCGEPGGGKNELTPRLTSNFICVCATALSSLSMRTIFNGILRGFLSINFAASVADMAERAVNATIEVYERIANEMLPTPEKTHYTFNLRDVSKVIQGMLQIIPARCATPDQLVKIWAHESSRVFHDRLINDDDREWWWTCVADTTRKHFKHAVEPAIGSALMYGSWADKKSMDYKEIVDSDALQELLKEAQHDYNTSNMKDVDLVLFKDAVGHLARICRILRQPRGNALLVGVGGSGRHSLCELSSSICSMDCKGIVIVRNYGVNEFRDDVKRFLLDAGAANKQLVFLLADNQLIFNQMLEDVNNILNIGEVPGLMGSEEFDKIMNGCREAAREQGKPETRNALYQFFVARCRENLHVIMCMSPVGAQFRDRLRMFPSLVNCMTIDWFTAWPRDALMSVSQRQLGTLDVGSDAVKRGVCEMAVHMHVTVKDESELMFSQLRRRNYTTPTSYLSLLSLYQEMYQEQNKIIGDNIRRYQNGLDKLDSTNTTIEQLKKRIREMQPVLAKAAKEADEQKVQLIKEQADADVVKTEVSTEEAQARSLMEEAEGIKKECEDGLAEALPALAAAEKALQTLSQKDIGEIKTFTTPPSNVEKTMNAVLILLKEKDGWATAKACLSKMDFLSRLTTYNRDDIAPALIRKLQPFIQDKEFVPEVIEKTSAPCKSMCMWVHAMYKYYHVAREIAPKRERLKDAEGRVQVARSELDTKQANLHKVIKKIEELQRTFKETEERKASLESQIVEAEAKLGRADQLIGGLASERMRWESQLKELKAQKTNIVGTMALAAGCVAYLGPFPAQYRLKLVGNWTQKCKELRIPVEDGFSLDRLPDQYTVREWALQSLPQDPFSIENATILQRSKRWCLMIDPQGQANQFIRKKEAKNKLKVVKLSDDTFMRTIESAVQVGHPVLLENVGETLDAALDPILLRQAVKIGARFVLKLGEKEVDYDPTFRFYITTKLPNPLFSPELQIKVTIVNFTVTRKGLEDQLLADTVATERADLQEKSDQCVVAIARGKAEIKTLEDQILKMLADASGDILDNVDLINTLSASKKTSDAISKDLEVVEKTNAEIETAREKYRSLATRGSLIYGVIADLSNIDPMYQFSLQFFKALCIQTIGRVPKIEPTEENPDIEAETVDARVLKLIPSITWTSYCVVCRGLFEKDKLLFSFLLGVSIFRHTDVISAWEWDAFLRGSLGMKPADKFVGKRPTWMEKIAWDDFASLCSNGAFTAVGDHFLEQPEEWKGWVQNETLYEVPVPGAAGGQLSEWHRMMIIKALRPEKLIFTMARVVSGFLGKEYTYSPQFSLKEAFTDSNNMAPLIFVLSTGTDPTVLFTTFAEEMGYKDRKLMLSLGQDQGKRAAQMIEEGRKDGLWVYLQNCHVYVSWMPALERIVESMRPEDTHPEFRLWLTSSSSPAFPVPVLQSGLKLTREPPKGLKANIKDSMHSLDSTVWAEQDGTDREREWKKLVFSLTFFHAIVQERRKFGPLGWNIAYEWSAPDWSASIKTLRIAINDFDALPWTAIQYTIGTLNYGGRVTDFLDNRCLQAICQRFFTRDLFNETYNFDNEGVYYAPEPQSKDDLLAFIDQLPQYETPQLFGLHPNANITFQAKESGGVMTTLIEIQPRGGSGAGGGKTPDQIVSEIADDLLTRCPAQVDPDKGHPSSFAVTDNGTMISLGTVLGQEIDQFNRLLRVTAASLRELKRAIKGEVVMSATMEMMYSMLSFNKVPDNWKKVGYLCLKPLASYFADLIQRIDFIASWCYNGAPSSFWLPGLFFPQGFVTGVFQTHSRKHKLSIDSIKFKFYAHTVPADEVKEPPTSGVYTHGYFLEGCSWSDANKLCESRPGVLYTPLPVIHLDPVPITEKNPPDVYECPLYKASTRAGILSTTGLSTNFVLTMQLPSPPEFKQEHWINRGVAALCMLDT